MAETYLDVEADVTPRIFRVASRRIAWWYSGRWIALVEVLLVLDALAVWLTGQSPELVAMAMEIAGGGALLLFFIFVAFPLLNQNRALSDGHMRFIARDDGYVVEGPFGTQTFRWSVYKKAYVDDRFIYLMLSRRRGQVIPLDVVADRMPMVDHLRRLGLLQPTPKSFFLF